MWIRNQYVGISGNSTQYLDCGTLDSVCSLSLLAGNHVWASPMTLGQVASSYVSAHIDHLKGTQPQAHREIWRFGIKFYQAMVQWITLAGFAALLPI